MKLFFPTRTAARAFPSNNGKVVDQGATSKAGRRWAFVINKAAK